MNGYATEKAVEVNRQKFVVGDEVYVRYKRICDDTPVYVWDRGQIKDIASGNIVIRETNTDEKVSISVESISHMMFHMPRGYGNDRTIFPTPAKMSVDQHYSHGRGNVEHAEITDINTYIFNGRRFFEGEVVWYKYRDPADKQWWSKGKIQRIEDSRICISDPMGYFRNDICSSFGYDSILCVKHSCPLGYNSLLSYFEADDMVDQFFSDARNMRSMEVQKVLVISTGHVSEETRFKLWNEEADSIFPFPVTKMDECSVMMPVTHEDIENVSDDLKRCLRLAEILGCSHLRLDSDGPQLPCLSYYE